jgi:hypothetical protein
VQLQSLQQLFTIAGHRTDRYKDTFSMTIVEVHNEKLFDLVSGTPPAERDGGVISARLVTNAEVTTGAGGMSNNNTATQLDDDEQFMFEQRLTQDDLGVAIRKINHSGKAQLRYVKCVPLENATSQKSLRALTWGKKNAVAIPLVQFVSVRKGKTTERTMRNACPSNRLLSILTRDVRNGSLDIEAPTRLDRDKFASAFSRFLGVPLEEVVDNSVGGAGGEVVGGEFGLDSHGSLFWCFNRFAHETSFSLCSCLGPTDQHLLLVQPTCLHLPN